MDGKLIVVGSKWKANPIKETLSGECCIKGELPEGLSIKRFSEDCPIKELSEECPIKELSEECPIKELSEECPIKELAEDCPMKDFFEECPIKELSEDCPMKDFFEEWPLKIELSENCPMKVELSEWPLKDLTEKSPIKVELTEELPIKEDLSEEWLIKEKQRECVSKNKLNSNIHSENKNQDYMKNLDAKLRKPQMKDSISFNHEGENIKQNMSTASTSGEGRQAASLPAQIPTVGVPQKADNIEGNTEKFTWTDEKTKLLLEELTEANYGSAKPIERKKIMRDTRSVFRAYGYEVKHDDLSKKLGNLTYTYRRIKENLNKSGEGNVKWEYFGAMDELMSKTREIEPSGTYTYSCGFSWGKLNPSSSVKMSHKQLKQMDTPSSSPDTPQSRETQSSAPARRGKKRNHEEDDIMQLIKMAMELKNEELRRREEEEKKREEAKRKREEEEKRREDQNNLLQQQLIDALSRLSDSVRVIAERLTSITTFLEN